MVEGRGGEGRLVCEGLSKRYEKRKQNALEGVTFSIPSRGIFALIGRNGAGKTTLIRILATELEPTSGRASINGLDVMKNDKRLRERIAIVPQEARTVAWMTPRQTIFSYLLWRGVSVGRARQSTEEAVGRLGLEKYADTMNHKLSGGTKRKVLVATVLASDADILFLDEPTTGLDPISRRELWDFLRELGRERFTFLTTHYLEEAEQLADRIGVLKDGKLLATGTLSEIRGTIKHQYSIKVPRQDVIPQVVATGELTTGSDGATQILTTEDEAFSIARRLSERGVKFSISPISLDDIFYSLVGQEALDEQP